MASPSVGEEQVEEILGADLAGLDLARRHDEAVRRLIVCQRTSAAVLRRAGRGYGAWRAEQAALRGQLLRDEPRAVARMFGFVRAVRETSGLPAALGRALEGAMSLLGADLGNIQSCATGRTLRVASHSGFSDDFLAHFAQVDDGSSACGRAARNSAQVVIADVAQDPRFEPHQAIAMASGFRAVQSTPILDRDGSLLGVLSTHFREPHVPASRDLLLVSWYGDQLGDLVRATLTPGAGQA